MSASLAARDVTIVRGGRWLVDDLSFAVAGGGALLVSGRNGVGKSSLLRALAGLLRPHAGSIDVTGDIAFLGESAALDGERPLAAALEFWARQDARADPATAVAAALSVVELGDLVDVPVRLLSTGQRRRAALARVVASGAAIWLLDEPANGLDTAAVARLATLIAGHRASGGIAVVATHQPLDLPDAQEIAL